MSVESGDLSPLTFGNEDRLPRVPLPTLEESCERLLAWCSPLLSPDELAETERAVAAFLEPDGPARTLQAALEAYDARADVDSWLDTFWPYRYLGRRDRIALNANFFFLLESSEAGQVQRAAALGAAAVALKLRIDAQELPPAVLRGRPLSMEQYKYLFSATRVPGPVQDAARTPYSEAWPGPSRARHIAVLHRGNLFRLDVIDPDGAPYAPAELAGGIRDVLAAGAAPARPGTSVGHLTTMARTGWATRRQALLDLDGRNAESLDAVETALFCLCLDDTAPADVGAASDQLLHGGSGNRWFDKAVSLVVFPDGTAGVNVEHCQLDGTTVVALVDAIMDPVTVVDPPRRAAPAVTPLEFVLDDELRAAVRAAAAAFAAYAADTATMALRVEGLTSTRAKQLRCSPDAFAQMTFQLAHQRAKGHLGATYESIATRHFRHGRTEAMRVVTPEVVRFIDAMTDPATGDATRRAALRSATEKHVARAKECQAGHAPEQHLWELQLIAQRRGAELGVTEPIALYDTPGWRVLRDDHLSTSSAPSANIRSFGFGSTSDTCIGVGYVLLPDRCDVYLSTPQSVREPMVRFADELPKAADELVALLAAEVEED